MLGQGLESLIPPQKKQASTNPPTDSPVVPMADSANVPAVREQKIDTVAPVTSSAPAEEKKPIFLPEEPAEKMLPEPPPAILHQETPLPATAATSLPTPTTTPSSPTPVPRPDSWRPVSSEAVFLVEVEKIKPNPHQPRRHFDEESLKDLGNSIREHGILQPLVVTKIESEVPGGTSVEYQLIAGERRLMASKLIGLERVPVIVRSLDRGMNQSLELAIIENLQREDLNPIEMARAFARLQDEFRMTQREIATRLGKSRETIANTLRLLDLPFDVQEAIASGQISESHGRLLLSLKNPAIQEKLFRDLVSKNMTTRELRAKVEAGEVGVRREKKSTPELQMFQEKLASFLGTPVKINQTGDSGRITINFYSHEELENILEHLSRILESEGDHLTY